MLVLSVRLLLLCAVPLLVLVLANAMPGINPVWDFANASGMLGGLLLFALFLYTGRPQRRPYYDGKFFMNLHRDLGYAATVLLALHIGVLLLGEPLVVNYLLPSAGLTMLSGTLALLLMLFVVPASLSAPRRKLWRNHAGFKRWHYWLSVGILVMSAIHVIDVGFYTGAWWKAWLWGLLTVVCVLRPLRGKQALERGPGPRRRNTAVLASWLSAGVLLFCLTLAAGFSLLANSDVPL